MCRAPNLREVCRRWPSIIFIKNNYIQQFCLFSSWALMRFGSFSIVVTTLVTSTKLICVELVSTGFLTTFGGYTIPIFFRPLSSPKMTYNLTHSRTYLVPLRLAIPQQVMSTRDGFGNSWGRNGEFCIALNPVTQTNAYCMA